MSGLLQRKHDLLRIKAFPRIHITLIGMNKDGYRVNGGIGFSISSPTLNMSFDPDSSICVFDKRSQGFTTKELVRLNNHLNNVMHDEHLSEGFLCVIEDGQVPSHFGFGSSTMVYLSCIEALLIINKREYTNDVVVNLSGRGGTSGIGINTYFNGCFVFDTGIVNQGERQFAPSSAFVSENRIKPLLLKNVKLPQWELGICIPSISPKTESDEKAFFHTNCPIEKEAVEKILYESVYGITSSLLETDFDTFCKSVDALQQTKWKKMERDIYGKELVHTETLIRHAGARCVGMSSLGPLLYFFGEGLDGIVKQVNAELLGCRCFKTSFNNSGRILEYD